MRKRVNIYVRVFVENRIKEHDITGKEVLELLRPGKVKPGEEARPRSSA